MVFIIFRINCRIRNRIGSDAQIGFFYIGIAIEASFDSNRYKYSILKFKSCSQVTDRIEFVASVIRIARFISSDILTVTADG